ncbi:MAG: response regulator transcription factor [Blastocatellia bacterium]|nr:response regulator transcription factor [Blastocatellia bacterium]
MDSPEIRIVIADDHPIFRKGLREIIEADPKLKIIGEAEDGDSALELIRQSKPDVAVLDVEMPGKDGLEVVRAARDRGVDVKVILLTMYDDEQFFNGAMDMGVMGYVLKNSAVADIVNCIKAVAEGKNYISPILSNYLINRSRRDDSPGERSALTKLTDTERRILKMIAEYKTSKEIAAELFISPRTVEHHRENMSEKLEIKGRNALLKFALENLPEI